jgi:anti-sigma-K factor RskA/putative zinc finger protein
MNESSMNCDRARDLAAGYVIGALEPSEEAAVREHLLTCPEPHEEFAELGGVVPYLAEADLELVEPPAALRDRIMAAAAADLAARGSAAGARPAAAIAFPTADERDARARARTGRIGWAMRIAAVVAIVALGGWNLLLQNELNAARRFDQAVATVISAAAQPGSKTVVLAPGKDSTASGIAAVRPDGSVVLAMRDLPATTGSQVYETWVIVGSAAPVAVGSFTVDANGIATFTTRPADAPPGATIAVTREPKAGNTAPEGPIVSAGVAVSAST